MFGRIVSLAIVVLLALIAMIALRPAQVGLLETIVFTVATPLHWAVGAPTDEVGRAIGEVATISELRQENADLKRRVDVLTRQAAAVPELEREVARLRDEMGLRRSVPSLQWIEARVILVDAGNLSRSIAINRGSRDGVQDGMTVMTTRGLVGRVLRATPSWSKVLLVTDVASSVSGTIQGSRLRGIISGLRQSTGSSLIMRQITQGEPIKPGDRIVTSGLGGVFPPGLVIGAVAEVRQRDTDLFQEATLEPTFDFDRLEEVLVVINHVPVKLD